MTTTSARPSSSAGPDTAGPVDGDDRRHDAGAGGQRPGRQAPAVEGGDALATSAPLEGGRPRAAGARRGRRGRPRRGSRRRRGRGRRRSRCGRLGPSPRDGGRGPCRAVDPGLHDPRHLGPELHAGAHRGKGPRIGAGRREERHRGCDRAAGRGVRAVVARCSGSGSSRTGWIPGWWAARSAMTCRSTSRRAAPGPRATLAPGAETDRPAGQTIDRDRAPVASEPDRDGAGRHDRGAEPLEGQGGHEPGAVDLGLGRPARSPARRTGPPTGRGSGRPSGSSSRGWPSRSARPTRSRRSKGWPRARSAAGPRRRAAR